MVERHIPLPPRADIAKQAPATAAHSASVLCEAQQKPAPA